MKFVIELIIHDNQKCNIQFTFELKTVDLSNVNIKTCKR